MQKVYIIYCLFVLCVCSCDHIHTGFVIRQAKTNKKEIEKVITRYKKEGDAQKIAAMKFIMKNMPYHSFLYSDDLVKAKDWFRLIRESPFSELEHVCDSMKSTLDVNYGLQRKWDLHELDSAFLCENIDMAFKVWREQPWGENVSFDMFCKYILPYRIGDEIPVLWRKDYYEEFNHLLDDFRSSDSLDITDPVAAYKHLVSKLPIIHNVIYTSMSPAVFPHIGPQYVKYNAGGCREFCDFMIYVCRALGIPCAINYRINDGHHWNTYWNKNADEYVVSYYPGDIKRNEDDLVYKTTKLKVYRNRYDVNEKELKRLFWGRAVLPFPFRVPLYEDVTTHFTNNVIDKIVIPDSLFPSDIKVGELLYLCTPVRNNWIAEDYALKGFFKTKFSAAQAGNVVCVAQKENGVFKPVTDPFIIESDTSEIRYFKQDGFHDKIVLKSKFHIEGEEKDLREMMRNGVFEGSINEDFNPSDTLAIIQTKPDRQTTRQNTYLISRKPYRYVRYNGPRNSYCGVAEVCFYDLSGRQIQHKRVIGTSSVDPQRTVANVFDGNPSTSYNYYYRDGGWCGLELSEKNVIGSISYTPRNRLNYIYADNEYELFYYDDGWNSLGRMIADSDSLVYYNVPDGPLLYLKNHTTGIKEMVFTYEDDKQCFYGCGMEICPNDTLCQITSNNACVRYSFLTPSADWYELNYDDGLWELGGGPFGSKRWCKTKWSSQHLYLRNSFHYSSTDDSYSYVLRGYINTLSVIYLNGTRIFTSNGTSNLLDLKIPHNLIKLGKNVLAIECANKNQSEEVICDLELLPCKNKSELY